MDGILTYLAGDVTAYDIVALVLGWLLFNAGFVAGAAWQPLHRKPEPPQPAPHKFRVRMWVG